MDEGADVEEKVDEEMRVKEELKEEEEEEEKGRQVPNFSRMFLPSKKFLCWVLCGSHVGSDGTVSEKHQNQGGISLRCPKERPGG